MEVIGFISFCAVLLYASFAWLVYATQTLGEYNIGGVPNTWKAKAVCLLLGAAIIYAWYVAGANAPFEIVVKA